VTDTTVAAGRPGRFRLLWNRRAARQLRPRTIVLAFLAYLVGLIALLPYAEMVISAARPTNQLLDRDYFPSQWNWSVFVDIWGSAFTSSLWVSLEIASGATLLVLLVAVPAAYYTARNRFRGRNAFLLLVLVTQMFQPTAMLVGLYREFLSLGMLNSVFALILINAGFNMAFTVWILNAYISAIPEELEEAAWIDGASRLGAFFRITIPLAMPGIVTSVIFTFIAAWNEFVVALTLTTSSAKAPLTVALNGYIGEYKVDWNHLFAGSVIATVPVIILFAMIEGKVVSGLTSGGLK
jgi:multiple sugar transport system permease protein